MATVDIAETVNLLDDALRSMLGRGRTPRQTRQSRQQSNWDAHAVGRVGGTFQGYGQELLELGNLVGGHLAFSIPHGLRELLDSPKNVEWQPVATFIEQDSRLPPIPPELARLVLPRPITERMGLFTVLGHFCSHAAKGTLPFKTRWADRVWNSPDAGYWFDITSQSNVVRIFPAGAIDKNVNMNTLMRLSRRAGTVLVAPADDWPMETSTYSMQGNIVAATGPDLGPWRIVIIDRPQPPRFGPAVVLRSDDNNEVAQEKIRQAKRGLGYSSTFSI